MLLDQRLFAETALHCSCIPLINVNGKRPRWKYKKKPGLDQCFSIFKSELSAGKFVKSLWPAWSNHHMAVVSCSVEIELLTLLLGFSMGTYRGSPPIHSHIPSTRLLMLISSHPRKYSWEWKSMTWQPRCATDARRWSKIATDTRVRNRGLRLDLHLGGATLVVSDMCGVEWRSHTVWSQLGYWWHPRSTRGPPGGGDWYWLVYTCSFKVLTNVLEDIE